MGSGGLIGQALWIIAAVVMAAAVVSWNNLAAPCTEPLRYHLGSIDGRFRTTENELKNALRRAEAVWEDALPHDLFRYAADGPLVVSLVYDTRQKVTQENAGRRDVIERTADTAGSLRNRYTAASTEYENGKRAYVAAQAAHAARLARHNGQVESWNARGGAPPAQLEAFRLEEERLLGSTADLEEQRLAVNRLAERANEMRDRYNQLASRVNENVEAINETVGRRYEQGIFAEDESGIRIDIFEFFDQEDLVRVLTHELGHALGLEHNRDPDSIMYEMNQSGPVRLSASDLVTLRRRCGIDERAPSAAN